MKAMRIHSYGDSGALHLDEVPVPTPGPGQALVRVAATTFNPVDVALRAGAMAGVFPLSFPYTPGLEISGTVVALGPTPGLPDHLAEGDRVVAMLPLPTAGGAAEYVVVDAGLLAPAPATVPLPDAAALPAAALTAAQALFEHGTLSETEPAAGRRVLINGAGGVVGGITVQLSKNAGATVIATAGPHSAARVRSLGADQVVDYTTAPVAESVTEPVDLIVNLAPVSADDFGPLTALLAEDGRAVTAVPIAIPEGESRWTFMNSRGDGARLAAFSAAVDRGELSLPVATRFPLSDLAKVQDLGAEGGTRGKLVVVVEG